jgi:hypothetical protein
MSCLKLLPKHIILRAGSGRVAHSQRKDCDNVCDDFHGFVRSIAGTAIRNQMIQPALLQ